MTTVASQVGTFTTAPGLTYAADILRIRTTGFATDADGGGATYDRWVTGMMALPAGAEGVWWFEAADASRWQIAPEGEHFAAMFGALGGSGVDALPILTEAFAAPMVPGINLGSLTHYFTPGLVVPSGKFLRGIDRAVSWLKVIPMTGPLTESTPRFAVLHQNDAGGFSEDYSLDCQRSGDYLAEHGTPHGVTVSASAGGTCKGTRVRRVDVHNCWGYSFYVTSGSPGDGVLVDDVWVEESRAINTNVGFEATGAVRNSGFRDTYVNAEAEDGGTDLACEAFYHHYGAIEDFTAYNVIGRGTALAGIMVFNTDDEDIGTIKYVNPDIDGTLDSGVFVETRNAAGTGNPVDGALNFIHDFQIVGGRVRATALGGILRRATVKIYQTKITGLDGNGLEISAGSDVELHGPDVEGNRNPAGATAALGIAAAGTINWYGGGRLAGIGPAATSQPADLNAITFYRSPELYPVNGDVDLVLTDKLYRVPRSSWLVDTPGQNFYVTFSLTGLPGGGVRDTTKTILVPSLEFPFPGGAVGTESSFSLEVLWIDTAQVRVYIITTAAMTGWVLKARLTEFA